MGAVRGIAGRQARPAGSCIVLTRHSLYGFHDEHQENDDKYE
jgi:hypothetical protein